MQNLRHTFGFPLMVNIIPATTTAEDTPQQPGWYIRHVTVSEKEAEQDRFIAILRGDWSYNGLEPGTYCVLSQRAPQGARHWMSDTWFERFTNRTVLRDARGDVLIAGLGIGMLPAALCASVRVRSVTVLELVPEVIALVAPHIRHPKLNIVLADAFSPPLHGRSFDYVYLDIWPQWGAGNWETMKPLLATYRRFQRRGGQTTAWLKHDVQRLARQERRQ